MSDIKGESFKLLSRHSIVPFHKEISLSEHPEPLLQSLLHHLSSRPLHSCTPHSHTGFPYGLRLRLPMVESQTFKFLK